MFIQISLSINMKSQLKDSYKILYINSDNLTYQILYDDIYKIRKKDINWFDTSDYSIDNVYDMLLTNKKMLGLIKVKTTEELCAKSYASDKKYTL